MSDGSAMPITAALASTDSTVIRTVQDGFDWGAAAVGAGLAVGLLLIVAAGLSIRGHHRTHPRRHP